MHGFSVAPFRHMPRVPTMKERLAEHLATVSPPPAILFVDGEEMIVCASEREGNAFFIDAQKEEPNWKEISLMVYKARYKSYLRTKMVMR